MQLIQLHTCNHGYKDAADSTASFFFHSGVAWAERPQAAIPECKNKDAVESAASL